MQTYLWVHQTRKIKHPLINLQKNIHILLKSNENLIRDLNHFSIIHYNAEGLSNKIDNFELFVSERLPQMVVVTKHQKTEENISLYQLNAVAQLGGQWCSGNFMACRPPPSNHSSYFTHQTCQPFKEFQVGDFSENADGWLGGCSCQIERGGGV